MSPVYKHTTVKDSKDPIRIVKDDRRKLDFIIKEVKSFKKSHVRVGVLEGEKRKGKAKTIMMAMIAAVHEYGSPKRKIPERSFIRSWVDGNKSKINDYILKLLRMVEDGKLTSYMALKKLGVYGVGGIRAQIKSIKTPPFKERTIKKKKSTQPLIDTGQLRNSIHYKVEKR
jgi:hypothetical protein